MFPCNKRFRFRCELNSNSLPVCGKPELITSKPSERRETGEQDLFRSRLEQMIDMTHELVRLAKMIDWRFLETSFGAVYRDDGGMPPLPT